jgi:hypothetical protein
VHRKTNNVQWVSSSIYYSCIPYMFRHLRAILRERLCPCEYVKTRQLSMVSGRSCINNKYFTKPTAQCWFFYTQPSNARYKHQIIVVHTLPFSTFHIVSFETFVIKRNKNVCIAFVYFSRIFLFMCINDTHTDTHFRDC